MTDPRIPLAERLFVLQESMIGLSFRKIVIDIRPNDSYPPVVRLIGPSPFQIEKDTREQTCIFQLRATIVAMGGELDIVARFPDGMVKITNFSPIFDFAF